MRIQLINTEGDDVFYDVDAPRPLRNPPYRVVCGAHDSAYVLWVYITSPRHKHRIQLRDDGWTIVHPPAESLVGDLLNCEWTTWPFEDDGRRGVFILTRSENGELTIGDRVSYP